MQRIFILGANGVLGRSLLQRLSMNTNHKCTGVSRKEIKLYNDSNLEDYFRAVDNCIIINCIGVLPDIAESKPDLSYAANYEVVQKIVKFVKRRPEFNLVQMSTSLVFDGLKRGPYIESDLPSPSSVYGKHKVLAENLILDEIATQSAVYRFGSLITSNPSDRTTFNQLLQLIKSKEMVQVEKDRSISIADSSLIVEAFEFHFTQQKILHITHSSPVSWLAIVQYVDELLGTQAKIATFASIDEWQTSFRGLSRPRNTSLGSEVQGTWEKVDWRQIVMRSLSV